MAQSKTMVRLEDLKKGTWVRGVLPAGLVAVVECKWQGPAEVELLYQDEAGQPGKTLLGRESEPSLEVVAADAVHGLSGLWQAAIEVARIEAPPAAPPEPLPSPAEEARGEAPFFSLIPGLVAPQEAEGALHVVAGGRVAPVPADLQQEWEAHAARLRALGAQVPGHVPLVVRNRMDNGLAVWIPPGKFSMGLGAGNRDERPAHLVQLEGFYLDICPVTNAQYAVFVRAAGHRPRQWKFPPGGAELAAVNLSWEDARAYCEWAQKRLPTEAEWEKAARGADSRLYPWGNLFDPRKASVLGNDYNRVSPVGQFTAGASPYGVLDMAGNVWEWVADWYAADYYGRSPSAEPQGPERGERRVLRGGAWICHPRYLRCTQREHQPADHCSRFVGFRCAF